GTVAAAPDLYPPLPSVVLPPGYLLRQSLLFVVPAGAQPARLVARPQRGGGQAMLDLAAAGKPAAPLPSRSPFSAKAFAQGVDVLQGYQATLVAVAIQDGRVRARVEAQNKTTDRIEPGRLISAQVI